MPAVNINGHTLLLAEGLTVLQALRHAGAEVPTLCHDERLQPHGGCRLCIVEVAGKDRPVSACDTQLADGMAISTDTPRLRALRRSTLRMLAAGYPADAIEAEPERPFHRYLREYDVLPGPGTAAASRHTWRDDSHPYLGVDMTKCINCYRCVRICDEVQGQSIWAVWGRGDDSHVQPASGHSLLESGCVSCGACADTCPTGAIYDKSVEADGAVAEWTTSTCVYCGTGCQVDVGTRGRKIVQIRPTAGAAVNQGHLCVKGRYAYRFNDAPDRITVPMVRDGQAWREVGWDTALGLVAERFATLSAESGPDAIGVLGSARATNEENYLAQKFARVVLGTNNVDCCARVCHQPSAAALKSMLGTGAATNSFDDIEVARTLMLVGCNPTENHPIVGARIKQAVKRGAQLIVIDPRRTELAAYADLHLPVRPGHNIQLFNALACTILEEGLADLAFITERVDDFDAFRNAVLTFHPEQVADECGVPADLIRKAARLYATARPSMCFHGLGVTEHTQGTEGVMALINLALITGNVGRPGSGINPLRGQNNVQGAAHMGCDPGTLTGGQSLPQARERFEALWRTPLPMRQGLNVVKMIEAAHRGQLKALWAIGYDVFPTLPNVTHTAEALRQLAFVVVQDLFLTETAARYGHVFLPTASVFEKDGTFMNSDRRVQRIRQAIEPPGKARTDAAVICELAKRLGKGEHFAFADAEAIWNEVRRVWPQGAGLSYHRIERESLHWPCPSESHPGTPILHRQSFVGGDKATLRRIPWLPSPEHLDEAYPWLLTTGRSLYHFNAGTMTYRTENTALEATDYLDVAPQDLARLGLRDGDRVQLRSRHGEAVLPVRACEGVQPGQLYATFHDARTLLNRVTSPHRDRVMKTPEYKRTAVALVPLPAVAADGADG